LLFNAVWALTSGGFRIVSDTLVNSEFATDVARSARLTWCQSLFFILLLVFSILLLRSAKNGDCNIPRVLSGFGQRSFSVSE